MSCHEVTRGQFREFVEETGYRTDAERDGMGGMDFVDGKWVQDPRFVWNANLGFPQSDDHPVVKVTWNDAVAFCQWLSTKDGARTHLPAEAQWEYACRAGTESLYHCGDSDPTLGEYAWSCSNAYTRTHPVGLLKPNAWRIHDLYGNVWELCADWWEADYYAESPMDDPAGPKTGLKRVTRGGSWVNFPPVCGSTGRTHRSPHSRAPDFGFRVVTVVADEMSDPEVETPRALDAQAWSAILPPDVPPPALAPFDADEAKKHQQAWADYLGKPVEQEVDLPGGETLKMILIPPGEFMMGSTEEERARFLEAAREVEDRLGIDRIPSEGPQHRVRIRP